MHVHGNHAVMLLSLETVKLEICTYYNWCMLQEMDVKHLNGIMLATTESLKAMLLTM